MSGESAGLLYLLLPVVLLIWLVSRGRRQQREVSAVQNRLTSGTQVMMSSGVYGEVVSVGDDGVVVVEIAPGVQTRWSRRAVAQVMDEPSMTGSGDEAISDQIAAEPVSDPPADPPGHPGGDDSRDSPR